MITKVNRFIYTYGEFLFRNVCISTFFVICINVVNLGIIIYIYKDKLYLYIQGVP